MIRSRIATAPSALYVLVLIGFLGSCAPGETPLRATQAEDSWAIRSDDIPAPPGHPTEALIHARRRVPQEAANRVAVPFEAAATRMDLPSVPAETVAATRAPPATLLPLSTADIEFRTLEPRPALSGERRELLIAPSQYVPRMVDRPMLGTDSRINRMPTDIPQTGSAGISTTATASSVLNSAIAMPPSLQHSLFVDVLGSGIIGSIGYSLTLNDFWLAEAGFMVAPIDNDLYFHTRAVVGARYSGFYLTFGPNYFQFRGTGSVRFGADIGYRRRIDGPFFGRIFLSASVADSRLLPWGGVGVEYEL